MMKKSRFIFYLFFLVLLSCKTTRLPEQSSNASDEKIAAGNGIKTEKKIIGRPANSEAKITATLLSIDFSRDSSDANSPCFKAPCHALIRIEKIERKGRLFHVPGSDEISVFFTFTLYPSDENLFPGSGKKYPGLKVNDKFEAVIESRPSMNGESRYIISDYKKSE